jgi:hypothetical protein
MIRRIELFIYRMIGQYDGYYTHPPMDDRKYYYNSYDLIKFNNDGHEVWMGSSDEWHWHAKHSEYRRIVIWYLYQWIIIDWFGLRTKIWFWLLRRKVNRERIAWKS